MNVRAAFAAGCVAACAIGAAQANAVYTYTGAEMDGTFFSVFGFPGCNCGSGPFIGPFSGSIDGTMTLSSPLAPHSNNVVVEPIALTFTLVGIDGPFGGAQQTTALDPDICRGCQLRPELLAGHAYTDLGEH